MMQLYFFKNRRRIKIGISRDVNKRLYDIARHSPGATRLLASFPGSFALERHIHKLLAQHHLGNEWFSDCQNVQAVIETLRKSGAAELGFKEIARAKPKIVPDVPMAPEVRRECWRRICEQTWPHDPIGGLAHELEVSTARATAWLDGSEPMSRVYRHAFAHIFYELLMKDIYGAKAIRETMNPNEGNPARN